MGSLMSKPQYFWALVLRYFENNFRHWLILVPGKENFLSRREISTIVSF